MSTTIVGNRPSHLHRPKGRAVSKWDAGNKYHLKAGTSTRMQDGLTAFEVEVLRLKLQPAQYQTSVQLREWARKWCSSRYVPESLLEVWGFKARAEAGFKIG